MEDYMKLKKTFILGLCLLTLITLFGCATTGSAQDVSNFTEVEAKDFRFRYASGNLWHGIILKNAAIYMNDNSIKIGSDYGDKITIWTKKDNLFSDEMSDEQKAQALKESFPQWIQDNYDVFCEQGFLNKPLYTVKLVLNRDFYPLSLEFTYDGTAELISIEGIEEAYEKNKIAEKEKAEQQALKEKENAEKQAVKEAKAKEIAKGYTYHGIDELEKNKKKMRNKTLEEGQAYYISDWTFNKNSTMYGTTMISIFEKSPDIRVDFINNDVKDEVLEAGSSIFGNLPIDIVVTGSWSGSAVILGVVE